MKFTEYHKSAKKLFEEYSEEKNREELIEENQCAYFIGTKDGFKHFMTEYFKSKINQSKLENFIDENLKKYYKGKNIYNVDLYDFEDDIFELYINDVIDSDVEPGKKDNDFINSLYKDPDETVQDYVKSLFSNLYEEGLLSNEIIFNLRNAEYCKQEFGLNFPLLSEYPIISGHARYWKTFKIGQYYVCNDWWKDKFPIYEYKLKQWVDKFVKKYL